MQRRRVAAALAGGVLLAAGLVAGPAPASALPDCATNKVCFYRGGVLIASWDPMPRGVCGGGFVGTWDTVRNNTSVHQYSYRGSGCSVGRAHVPPAWTVGPNPAHYSYSGD